MSSDQLTARDQFGQTWTWPLVHSPTSVGNTSPDDTTGQFEPDRAWIFLLPGAFTPVCTSELGWINSLARTLAPQSVGVRVIATDAVPVLRVLADQLGLEVPLLSDFWPHGAISQRLDAFNEVTGRPERASFLLSAQGEVLRKVVAQPGQERRFEDHLLNGVD